MKLADLNVVVMRLDAATIALRELGSSLVDLRLDGIQDLIDQVYAFARQLDDIYIKYDQIRSEWQQVGMARRINEVPCHRT